MEEEIIFGEDIEIINPRINDCETIFDNININGYTLYLKIENYIKNFLLSSDTFISIQKLQLIFLNKIFNQDVIYTEKYVYIPLKVKFIGNSYLNKNIKQICLHDFSDYKKVCKPKLIKLKTEPIKSRFTVFSCRDTKYNGLCLGIPYKIYILMIVVEDTFVENITDICNFTLDTPDRDREFFSFEDMETKNFDISDEYTNIGGYIYYLNFTNLEYSELLDCIINNDDSKLKDEGKFCFNFNFSRSNFDKVDIYIFGEKLKILN